MSTAAASITATPTRCEVVLNECVSPASHATETCEPCGQPCCRRDCSATADDTLTKRRVRVCNDCLAQSPERFTAVRRQHRHG